MEIVEHPVLGPQSELDREQMYGQSTKLEKWPEILAIFCVLEVFFGQILALKLMKVSCYVVANEQRVYDPQLK
jgi:hypothetical protein